MIYGGKRDIYSVKGSERFMKVLRIGKGIRLKVDELSELVYEGDFRVELTEDAHLALSNSQRSLQELLVDGKPIYGINTGFGQLAEESIPDEQLRELQVNLIYSHAAGSGKPVSEHLIRLAMILRLHSLALGYSGISLELADMLLKLINSGIVPIVPTYGSVGASGDLIPLAHIALALLGEGKCSYKGRVVSADEALKDIGLTPYKLKPKEGLALINGTCFSSALLVYSLPIIERLIYWSHVAMALGLAGLSGTAKHFNEILYKLKPHRGLKRSLDLCRQLTDSLKWSEAKVIQEPYSYRCAPYIYATAFETLELAREIVEIEINSVTDNPVLYEGQVISGGNFHGNHLAVLADNLRVIIAQLANLSFYRLSRLLDKRLSRGLPPFLAIKPGLNSGYMISHYLASSLTAEIRVLATPISVNNLPVSGNQEDMITYSQSSATFLMESIDRLLRVIALELMVSTHACKLRGVEAEGALGMTFKELKGLLGNREVDSDEPIYQVQERFITWLSEKVKYLSYNG